MNYLHNSQFSRKKKDYKCVKKNVQNSSQLSLLISQKQHLFDQIYRKKQQWNVLPFQKYFY